jgi:hypothetical protein
MSVAQRIFAIALVFLLAWGQLALARHVLVHATPGIDTCELCVSQAQSSGGIVPPTVCLVVIADNGPFFQTHHQSHLPLLPARPQQARAPPFIA